MVTRQPHHEAEDAENRTSPDGPCGDVAAYVLGVLDPAQHVIFSRHLAGCESCQRDAADFGMFAPVLRQVVGQPTGRPPCRITRGSLRNKSIHDRVRDRAHWLAAHPQWLAGMVAVIISREITVSALRFTTSPVTVTTREVSGSA